MNNIIDEFPTKQDILTLIEQRVYDATGSILQDLENVGIFAGGNAHRTSQRITSYAKSLLEERWIDNNIKDKYGQVITSTLYDNDTEEPVKFVALDAASASEID